METEPKRTATVRIAEDCEISVADLGVIRVGSAVYKPKGYSFPGHVRTIFRTPAGEIRLVVESRLAPGMMHIFSPNQMLPDPHDSEFLREVGKLLASTGATN